MSSSFKLTPQAETAIADIVNYTDANFGEQETAAYLAGLEASFTLLVSFPGIGTQAFEIEAGLRRYRYQSHYIFYSVDADVVLIRHVLHVSRSIRRDLFDN